MRPATKSILMLLQNDKFFCGTLVNPSTKSSLNIDGGGKFEIIGKLRDKGYEFGPLTLNLPKWIIRYIPNNFDLIGICPVLSMPFTHPNECRCEECKGIL